MKPNPFGPVTDTINHVVFVIDVSDSMRGIDKEVVKVTDQLIKDLADLSQQLNQETRVSIYFFSEGVWCIVYDKDVLRLPSLAGIYRTISNTALIDATLLAQSELAMTATLHGNHSFLIYVITDGAENSSQNKIVDLQQMFKTLPEDVTMAALVPNASAKFTAEKYGFARGNIQIWDATSEAGMREAGRVMRESTAGYMTARASGLKSTTGLFDMSADAVNHKTVAQLREITTGIEILPVKAAMDITTFITKQHKRTFRQGKYYFPLVKREKVGPQKNVVVRHKISGKVFGGPEVRTLLGLPDHEVSIKPGINDLYDVFVQSTSTNRNLIPGHDLLVIE